MLLLMGVGHSGWTGVCSSKASTIISGFRTITTRVYFERLVLKFIHGYETIFVFLSLFRPDERGLRASMEVAG